MILLQSEYLSFFNKFPLTAQLSLKMLIPKTYKEITTDFLTALFIQNGMIKKSVIESMKATSQKTVEKMLKPSGDDKRVLEELDNLKVSDECAYFLNDVIYFMRNYGDRINDSDFVNYTTWRLIVDDRLFSYTFIRSILYKDAPDNIAKNLIQDVKGKLGVDVSQKLMEFGKYLIHPLLYTQYKCFGRNSEIERSIDILSRKKKRNLMLVGNPGVGKTSVVYGICNYLQSDKCPDKLKGFSVFELNVSAMISGTMYRGDLEKRIEALTSEIRSSGKIILFVDEIQTLFGSGFNTEGELQSIQQQLKPFLQEESFLIGCTTESDYKTIETDKAFERRFSVIEIPEMTYNDTINLLIDVKSQYESYHSVSVSDDCCEKIVDDCQKFIKNRYFPDKAIDVLDVSCVEARKSSVREVLFDHIDTAIHNLSNVSGLSSDIDSISNSIKSRIFGQDHAVDSVLKSFKRYKLGVNDKSKPIGSFLFVGKTGTGKTELCKQLANSIFSNESFLRYDMSEFMEPHSVSKIIGSPPGYVGYSSGGSLTERVKHNPFAIILFDEIEKAHPDVINILLQIMDDGRLTDSFGNTVNFANCFIVMTSNLGCSNKTKTSIGFSNEDITKQKILDSVNDHFSPEFLARLDDIIYFNDISDEILDKVVLREICNFVNNYIDVGIKIDIDDDVSNYIKTECRKAVGGARAIQRTVRDIIESHVIDLIPGSYRLCYDNDELAVMRYD